MRYASLAYRTLSLSEILVIKYIYIYIYINLALVKSENRAGRINDFGNFLSGFAKSPRVLRTVLNIE